MIKMNRNNMKDKIYACWLGKNIGGTIGTPYEGRRTINDIKGFETPPGEPLVNDDLDLQLVWLKAMEDLGPKGVNERTLGEYWLSYITPHWNEYGTGKSNMREGYAPPMSGEINNEEWRNSNGAWIRTEIWASLFPGQPEEAIRYAYYDACVDHGLGEGTYAAIFVEAIESAAFVINDIHKLINIGLSKIPENSRVAKSVRLVVSEYEKGTDWADTRNLVVEDSKDLGWFQAPANVAFTILGLLYGECDFKKSLLTAVNCGDDTDCTGATVGALLGIMYGIEAIPKDWRDYIGDNIVSGCLVNSIGRFPKTCTQLTNDVLDLLPVTTHQSSFARNAKTQVIVYDGEDDYGDLKAEDYYGSEFAEKIGSVKPYSFIAENVFAQALIELDKAPYIKPCETITGTITVENKILLEQKHFSVRFITDDGFTVTGNLNLHTCYIDKKFSAPAKGKFSITAPETVKAVNKIVIEITTVGRFTPIYAQLILMG